MKLSANFQLDEFLLSQKAERIGGDMLDSQRNPDPEVVSNLQYLVKNTLQPIRTLLKSSITITSGYRCLALNRDLGSRDTSQHVKGEAADLKISSELVTRGSRDRIRKIIEHKMLDTIGKSIRSDASANFYLFACICFYLDELDIDQVIHEYGVDGSPGWIHVSSSASERNKRQILLINSKGTRQLDMKSALELGC
ncbi:MAG: hypothetical protein GY696_33570 [Gammaproteobacteria bacterium]|nr:hypothetical protein [Gammaproteobacteria bacterium]